MIIRKAVLEDVSGLVHAHINSLKTSHKGILSQDFLDNLNHKWSTPRFTEALSNPKSKVSIYVAESHSKQIAGFIWGGKQRKDDDVYKGEIYAIYLLNEYQRLGLGSKLVKSLVNDLMDFGINSMLVSVFAENASSRQFYESVGGQKILEGTVEVNGQTYKDITYGWTDIKLVFGLK
ncbi:acetyltransferase [Paenibacillus marchantiophytorum]|uniref:Acetyltransferase n=1 Tax=Paenibacillus marchantiophytorum TaxID=1619310 RepID=A0ABQ1ELW1_9BACL|nr:GNAT family N-acetyltransferase [Paenibacillus marchantiophytorum]GFZ77661.1 acetyltransferase [Paenibacillus marchantiophytorum]